jgi:hypothetical protein
VPVVQSMSERSILAKRATTGISDVNRLANFGRRKGQQSDPEHIGRAVTPKPHKLPPAMTQDRQSMRGRNRIVSTTNGSIAAQSPSVSDWEVEPIDVSGADLSHH